MKKFLALMLAMTLSLSLAACGGNDDAANSGAGESPSASSSPSGQPSESPSAEPSEQPSEQPSESTEPSEQPSEEPSGQPSESPSQESAPAFALSLSDFSLFAAGDSWTLDYTANPVLDESPVYSSADESVATVDQNGTVTAVAPGTTTITATYGDHTATCIVRCKWEAEGAPASVDLYAFLTSLANDYGENFAANMSLTDVPEYLDSFYPGLNAIETNQLHVYQPMMGAVVCEIALIEVANAADMDAVKAILQARIDTQAQGGAWYPESVDGWLNNSRIVSNGNYVMMIAWQYCDEAVASFNALF